MEPLDQPTRPSNSPLQEEDLLDIDISLPPPQEQNAGAIYVRRDWPGAILLFISFFPGLFLVIPIVTAPALIRLAVLLARRRRHRELQYQEKTWEILLGLIGATTLAILAGFAVLITVSILFTIWTNSVDGTESGAVWGSISAIPVVLWIMIWLFRKWQ